MFIDVCVCAVMLTFVCRFPTDGQEEQHANTSANYDVELLHHRDAHLEFFKSGGCSVLKAVHSF